MPGVIPTLRDGPSSFQFLAVSGSITGGQLVVPDPLNKGGIITAQGGAVNVLGVAGLDAQLRTNQSGVQPTNLAQQSPWIPVYYGDEMPVTYSGVCDLGRLLIAGANGSVIPYTPPDIIGDTYPGGNPAVPATGVAVANVANSAVQVIVTGGTLTQILVNGVQAGTAAGTFQVPQGGNIAWVGTVAPTWAWTLVGATVTTPSVPLTTVPVVNTTGVNVQVVVTGGTMTAVVINGAVVGAGAGTYTLPAGGTITMTFSAAPTWAWTPLISTFDQIVGRCTEPTGVPVSGTVARARIGAL